MDISSILEQWPYEPDKITVRKVAGNDGLDKIQMRLDLGLLQMESVGRPDGRRPHGFESLLEYYESQRELHRQEHGTEKDFKLPSEECAELRNEALQYYYRYLSLLHLEDYHGVERDTARNLRVFDLIHKHAENDEDRLALERYRPYVLMMNARAHANIALRQNRPIESLRTIEETIDKIRNFLREHDREDYFDQSGEVLFLKQLAQEIRGKMPRDPREDLRKRMRKAVQEEDYELAAKIRDEIRRLEGRVSQQHET